jgi:hypothetical protein
MADEKRKADQQKTLEMRVAELEDKLSQVHITEEEMRAYQKVASLMGSGAAMGSQMGPQAAAPNPIQAGCIVNCVIYRCIIRCIITDCINECGGGIGGGFGGFGM